MYILQSPAPPLISRLDLLELSSRKHKSRTVPSCIVSSIYFDKKSISDAVMTSEADESLPLGLPIVFDRRCTALALLSCRLIRSQLSHLEETMPCSRLILCGVLFAWIILSLDRLSVHLCERKLLSNCVKGIFSCLPYLRQWRIFADSEGLRVAADSVDRPVRMELGASDSLHVLQRGDGNKAWSACIAGLHLNEIERRKVRKVCGESIFKRRKWIRRSLRQAIKYFND